jgi:hypothetical protein
MFHRRRRLFGPAAVVAAFAIAFPLGVLAAITFTDVPVSNPFYYDIQAVANAGVTTGCGGGKYCPDDNVTRGQMAAFMNRLGALGPGKVPVVDADKLDGLDSTSFLRAGPITQQHFGPWTPNGNTAGFTIATFSDAVGISSAAAGSGFAQVPLVAPTSIGGVSYGLQSLRICTSVTSTNVAIGHTYAYDGFSALIDDATSRTPGSCYVVTDATPTVVAGNQVVLVTLNFSAAGRLLVTSTTSTWVPTTLALASVPAGKSGTTSR